jgi:hypothetical protein
LFEFLPPPPSRATIFSFRDAFFFFETGLN